MPTPHVQGVPHLFVRVANKQLDRTKRSGADKKRLIQKMFLLFVYHADSIKMPDKFQKWLLRKGATERARLYSDQHFVALLVDGKISCFWEIGEFKKMWGTPVCQDKMLYKKLYGGYIIDGSALAQVFGDTSNIGSFEVRIRVLL